MKQLLWFLVLAAASCFGQAPAASAQGSLPVAPVAQSLKNDGTGYGPWLSPGEAVAAFASLEATIIWSQEKILLQDKLLQKMSTAIYSMLPLSDVVAAQQALQQHEALKPKTQTDSRP